jgi:hypothetical protein
LFALCFWPFGAFLGFLSLSLSFWLPSLLPLLFSSVLSHCHHHRLQFLFSSLFPYFSLCPTLPLWYSLFCAIVSVSFMPLF